MQMDRRAVVSAGILAVPSAAFATIGDAPKQAYFGAKPMSAPFGEVYGQTGAPLWEKLGETEKGIYERILSTSRESLRKVTLFLLWLERLRIVVMKQMVSGLSSGVDLQHCRHVLFRRS